MSKDFLQLTYIQHLPEVQEESLELDSEVVLKAIEAQHGLLVERAKSIYSFSHLTIQEYFTAKYIVDNQAEGTLQDLVEQHLLDKRWREVLILTTGMLEKADEFLLAMRAKISTLATDAKFVALLKNIKELIKPIPYPPYIGRSLAIELVSSKPQNSRYFSYLSCSNAVSTFKASSAS